MVAEKILVKDLDAMIVARERLLANIEKVTSKNLHKSELQVVGGKDIQKKEEQKNQPTISKVFESADSVDKSIPDSVKGKDVVRRAIRTNKLVYYVIAYCTGKTDKLVKLSESQMIFCNSVAEYMGHEPMYSRVQNMTIKLATCDPAYNCFNKDSEFVVSLQDLDTKVKRHMDKKVSKEAKKEAETVDGKQEHPRLPQFTIKKGGEKYVDVFRKIVDVDPVKNVVEEIKNAEELDKPLVETMANQKIDPLANIEENVSDKAHKTLDDIIQDHFDITIPHKYEMSKEGLFMMHYLMDNKEMVIILDPFGIVMGGNKPYIMANVMNDTIMVPLDYKAHGLIKQLFLNPFYVIDNITANDIAKQYFSFSDIYRYIDMSDTDWLNKLTEQQKEEVGYRLANIITESIQNGGTVPRMRFLQFTDSKHFIVGSDYDCLSPLYQYGDMTNLICEGLQFVVNDTTITQNYNGQSLQWDFSILK